MMKNFLPLALLLFALPVTAQSPPHYTISDLGTLGDPNRKSVANGINNKGQVVGTESASQDFLSVSFLPFLWEKGRMRRIGSLPGRASAINNQGQIIGTTIVNTGDLARQGPAFLFQHNTTSYLGSLKNDNNEALAINEYGAIVGDARVKPSQKYTAGDAVVWHNKTRTVLPVPPCEHSTAYGINDKGDIVGSVTANDKTRPFMDRQGEVKILQVPQKYTGGRAYAVNNHGVIVGYVDVHFKISFKKYQQNPIFESLNSTHAAVWINGKMSDLGTLANNLSAATDVNDGGQIVGYSDSRERDARRVPVTHAVLWQGMKIYDLNAQIPAQSHWLLRSASAINNRSQIVGDGTHNGKERAFLLTPINP